MFKEYASRLVKAGCEVKVITSNSGGLEGNVSYDGVETHYFRWPSLFGHPIPRRKDLVEFVEWSDVVHAATYTAAAAALSVSEKLDRPCVATVYEALGEKWFWIERNVLKSLAFYLFEDYVIKKDYSLLHAISLATRNDLIKKGVSNDRIATVYPGISERFRRSRTEPNSDEHSSILAPDKNDKIFLFFGRAGQTKGVFVLLDAIRRIRQKLPKGLRFVFILSREPIAGREKLLKLIVKYQLDDIVETMPPLSDENLIKAITAAFCVIIPSITEGFGYTTVESCSLGKPVIVSDGGSLPEVAFGRVLFFQNRNSVDLSEKILMASQSEFLEIPEKDFDWDVSTRALMTLYESLIETKQRRD